VFEATAYTRNFVPDSNEEGKRSPHERRGVADAKESYDHILSEVCFPIGCAVRVSFPQHQRRALHMSFRAADGVYLGQTSEGQHRVLLISGKAGNLVTTSRAHLTFDPKSFPLAEARAQQRTLDLMKDHRLNYQREYETKIGAANSAPAELSDLSPAPPSQPAASPTSPFVP
jgi:hypothetical protein